MQIDVIFRAVSGGTGSVCGSAVWSGVGQASLWVIQGDFFFSLLFYLPIYFRSIDPPHHDGFYSSGPSCSKADQRLDPGLNLTRVSLSCVQKHFLG